MKKIDPFLHYEVLSAECVLMRRKRKSEADRMWDMMANLEYLTFTENKFWRHEPTDNRNQLYKPRKPEKCLKRKNCRLGLKIYTPSP